MLSIVFITSFSNLAIVCLPRIIKRHQQNSQHDAMHQGNLISIPAFFQCKNATKEFINAENKTLILLLKVINLESYNVFDAMQRRKINLFFMECLMEAQLGYPQAILWLKKHFNLQACDVIICDWHYLPHGRIEKMKNVFSTHYHRLHEYFGSFKITSFIMKLVSIIYEPVKRLLLMIVAYIDLISDSLLLLAIMNVLGPAIVWNNPGMFSSQVGILLLASIVIPLLISAITLANERPLIVLDSKNWIK